MIAQNYPKRSFEMFSRISLCLGYDMALKQSKAYAATHMPAAGMWPAPSWADGRVVREHFHTEQQIDNAYFAHWMVRQLNFNLGESRPQQASRAMTC